jgi:hypothetical protein
MTEQHEKINQWKKDGDNKTRSKWTNFTFIAKGLNCLPNSLSTLF